MTGLPPAPGRWVHTGLTPHPIDTWALARWNEGVRRARDAYDRIIHTRGFGVLYRTCAAPGCNTRTQDEDTGLCFECRRTQQAATVRAQHLCTRCQKVSTRHDTGLCWDCRQITARIQRAEQWGTCQRPGCGRATRNRAPACTECLRGNPPSGPGHHWSHRYRNL